AQERLIPTAFEIETVMAFLVMKQWNVDVAIIECGMGGKMDATNIITAPVLCLFAHIGLDHTALLGETVEEIATEKAGILKSGCAAVSVKQDKSVEEILQHICLEQGISLSIADPREVTQIRYDMQGTTFCYGGSVLKMGQQGTYQIENVVAAMEAAKVLQGLGYDQVQEPAVRDAIACSHHRGRFECICEKPYVIVDGAHNPQAAAELRHSLEAYFPGEQFTYICGVFRDKDYVRMMDEMLPLASRVYTVKPPGERGLPAALLSECIDEWRESHGKGHGRAMPVQPYHSVTEALDRAAQGSERILVFGSLSFLHEVYEYFEVSVS
ncbi:MAG: bifunctional folylpolyglutamate synthase/dihydrofolate synthase, partial [Lachnospiraceae bacterium]|nr:bifunctional folylpolyglutamate synthase/dihydrofolate synthase [Lachnospiraceae bacterium]